MATKDAINVAMDPKALCERVEAKIANLQAKVEHYELFFLNDGQCLSPYTEEVLDLHQDMTVMANSYNCVIGALTNIKNDLKAVCLMENDGVVSWKERYLEAERRYENVHEQWRQMWRKEIDISERINELYMVHDGEIEFQESQLVDDDLEDGSQDLEDGELVEDEFESIDEELVLTEDEPETTEPKVTLVVEPEVATISLDKSLAISEQEIEKSAIVKERVEPLEPSKTQMMKVEKVRGDQEKNKVLEPKNRREGNRGQKSKKSVASLIKNETSELDEIKNQSANSSQTSILSSDLSTLEVLDSKYDSLEVLPEPGPPKVLFENLSPASKNDTIEKFLEARGRLKKREDNYDDYITATIGGELVYAKKCKVYLPVIYDHELAQNIVLARGPIVAELASESARFKPNQTTAKRKHVQTSLPNFRTDSKWSTGQPTKRLKKN